MTATPDGSAEPAPPWSHLLVETGHMDEVLEPIKSSARIQYTCVSVSHRYLALGSNTGYIYIFSKDSHKYLTVLPGEKEGAIDKLAFNPDDHTLAYANSHGFVTIVRLRIDQRNKPEKVRSTYDHKDSKVTALKWHHHGNQLYIGDDQGRVSVANINIKARDLLKPSSEVIMRLESVIIQIDTFGDRVLVSTLQRSFLGFTTKHQFKQIGTRARDGYYGACFYHTDVMEMPVIYCGRPGSRMWEVDSEGEVLNTHQFKHLLAVPSLPVMQLRDEDTALYPGVISDDVKPQSINYQQLYFFGNQFLLAWNSKGMYLFDPAEVKVILWTDNIRGHMEVDVLGNDIFILQNYALRKIELLPIPKLIAKVANSKQWLLAASLCQCFQATIINSKTRRHVPVSMVREILEIMKLPSLQQDQLVQDLEELLPQLQVPSESRSRSSSSISSSAGKVPQKLEGQTRAIGSGDAPCSPEDTAASQEREAANIDDSTSVIVNSPQDSCAAVDPIDLGERSKVESIPENSEEEDSSECDKLPVTTSSEDPEKEAILSEVYHTDILAREIDQVTEENEKVTRDPRLSMDKLKPLLTDSGSDSAGTHTVNKDNVSSMNLSHTPHDILHVNIQDANQSDEMNQPSLTPHQTLKSNCDENSSCSGQNCGDQDSVSPNSDLCNKIPDSCCDPSLQCPKDGCDDGDITMEPGSALCDSDAVVGCGVPSRGDVQESNIVVSSVSELDNISVDVENETQYPSDDCLGKLPDDDNVDGLWNCDSFLEVGKCELQRELHSSGETDSGILVRHSSMESLASGRSSATASVSSSELMASNISVEPEPIFAKSKEKPVKSKGKKLRAVTVDLDMSDPIAIPAVTRIRRSQTVLITNKKKKRTRRTISESVPSSISMDRTSPDVEALLTVPFLPQIQKSSSLTHLTEIPHLDAAFDPTSVNQSHSNECLSGIGESATTLQDSVKLKSSPSNKKKMDFKLKDSVFSAISSLQSRIGTISNSKESIQPVVGAVENDENDLDKRDREEIIRNSSKILRRMSGSDAALIDDKLKCRGVNDSKENGVGSLESSLEVEKPDLLSTSPSTKLSTSPSTKLGLHTVKERISTTTKSFIQTLKDKKLPWNDENLFQKENDRYPELLDVASPETIALPEASPSVTVDISHFRTVTESISEQLKQPEVFYQPSQVRVLLNSWCHELHKLLSECHKKSSSDLQEDSTVHSSRDENHKHSSPQDGVLEDSVGDSCDNTKSNAILMGDTNASSCTAGGVNECNLEMRGDDSMGDSPKLQPKNDSGDLPKAHMSASSVGEISAVIESSNFDRTRGQTPGISATLFIDETVHSNVFSPDSRQTECECSLKDEKFSSQSNEKCYCTRSIDHIIHVKDPFLLPEDLFELASGLACQCFEFRCHGNPSHHVAFPSPCHCTSSVDMSKSISSTKCCQNNGSVSNKKKLTQGVGPVPNMSSLRENLTAEDGHELDYELSIFLRVYFHFFFGSIGRVHKAILLSKGRKCERWNSLLKSLEEACKGDLIYQALDHQQVEHAFDLLQVKIAHGKGIYCLGYLNSLYQVAPFKTLEFCASDMREYISPFEVLYLCQRDTDTGTHFLYYINSYLPPLQTAKRGVVMEEVCRDREVRCAWLSALLQQGVADTDASLCNQLACQCGHPWPGAHRVMWKQQSILDGILSFPSSHDEVEKELCHNNHYWRGYLQLLAATGERDLWQTYALQLGDVDLLTDAQGCGPCSAKEWEVLLCKKGWQHHGNLLKKILARQNSADYEGPCPIYCLNCGSDLTGWKQENPRKVASKGSDWLPTVTWQNIVTHLVTDVGPQRGLELLKKTRIPCGALTFDFYEKCIAASVVEHHQKLHTESALEKLDSYLWSKRSPNLPPQLSYAVQREKLSMSASEDHAAGASKLFLGLQETPPSSMETLEDQEIHWGIDANVLRWCRCCGLSLMEVVCHLKPGCIFFRCGHGYHRACVQETVCVACLSDSSSSALGKNPQHSFS